MTQFAIMFDDRSVKAAMAKPAPHTRSDIAHLALD